MLRGVLALVLCCGAAAQMVLLNEEPLPSVTAEDALGKTFGEDGTLVMVADWLAREQADYFRVPGFDQDDEITIVPDEALAPSREASELERKKNKKDKKDKKNKKNKKNKKGGKDKACGRGWAKLEEGKSICFNDERLCLDENARGWTNKIKQGDDFMDIPVYIGASKCRAKKTRFNIDVKFEGSTITVDLSNGGRNKVQSASVWIGRTMLPKKKGDFTGAAKHFPVQVKGKKQDPVLVFEDVDEMETYWFAVRVSACQHEEPEPTCPSTFYAVQYFCQHGPCTDGVNGNLASQLLADDWEPVRAFGVCFTTAETGGFPHETRVLSKSVEEEEDLPASEGNVKYLGLFATGCEEGVTPPPPTVNPGPVRSLCKENCPPGSAGFVGYA